MDMNETTNTTAAPVGTFWEVEALGKRQRNVLSALARHGSWSGTEWVWENHSTTATVLKSMMKHGLVEFVVTSGDAWQVSGEYRPTRRVEIYFTGSYIIR